MVFNLGLIGTPIKHSLSPKIHQYFAKQFNHNIRYELYEINNLEKFLQKFKQYGHGLNITTPFKKEVLNFIPNNLHNANVITIKPKLQAFCVDGKGFINACKHLNWNLHNKNILIIGAGNTAHSLISELKNNNNLIIAARSFDKANKNLLKHKKEITIKHIDNINQQFDIIVQASSAGLNNTLPNINPYWIKPSSFVMDLNYGKNAQQFLSIIKKFHPKQIIDGRFMLIEQAALSYFLWTGSTPCTSDFYKAENSFFS